jgi:hypothetical protein
MDGQAASCIYQLHRIATITLSANIEIQEETADRMLDRSAMVTYWRVWVVQNPDSSVY